MNNVEKEFVREHKKFIEFRMRSIWNGEQIREIYPKNELIGHELLFEECFYLWNDANVNHALFYIREAYPETTVEDCRRVYESNLDFICGIYG